MGGIGGIVILSLSYLQDCFVKQGRANSRCFVKQGRANSQSLAHPVWQGDWWMGGGGGCHSVCMLPPELFCQAGKGIVSH